VRIRSDPRHMPLRDLTGPTHPIWLNSRKSHQIWIACVGSQTPPEPIISTARSEATALSVNRDLNRLARGVFPDESRRVSERRLYCSSVRVRGWVMMGQSDRQARGRIQVYDMRKIGEPEVLLQEISLGGRIRRIMEIDPKSVSACTNFWPLRAFYRWSRRIQPHSSNSKTKILFLSHPILIRRFGSHRGFSNA
jgi:hypothetical protein